MANSWLRLWHEMPSDPKFRTISKVSKRPLSEVIAVYLNLLVDASRNVTRGHVDVTNEDLASAIDVEIEHIDAIIQAMEGRLIESGKLNGWDSRQVQKEDSDQAKSASQRKREQRERDKSNPINEAVTTSHDKSRNVTLDKDKDKEYINTPLALLMSMNVEKQLASDWLKVRKEKKSASTKTAFDAIKKHAESNGYTFPQAIKICAERGWVGFDVSWLKDSTASKEVPAWQKNMVVGV